MSRHAMLWLLGAALAGCAAAPTEPLLQAHLAVVPERFEDTEATSPVNAPLPWEQFFSEPLLQQRIRWALQHNRDLRLATLNVEQARAQWQAREADLWPTVNAGLGGSRAPTNTGGVSTIVSGGLLTSAYEVDLFGRVRQSVEAAEQQFQASRALRQAAQATVVAAVVQAHVNLQADEQLLNITQSALRTRDEALAMVRARLRVGAASALDLAQAESAQQAARAALAQVQRQQALDLSTLQLLLGSPLPAPLATTPAGVQALSTVNLPVGLSSEVLVHRPDLWAAEAQLLAQRAQLSAARRAFFPRITLTGSYGQASKDLSGLFQGGTWVWGVAPQLLLTVFDAGRTQAQVAAAQAAEQAAVAQYEKAIQVAFKEVLDALNARRLWAEQVDALAQQVAAEQQRVTLADTRHRLGASPYLEVLDAQRSLLAAQTAWVQAQVGQQLAVASLYKALGGGASVSTDDPDNTEAKAAR